MRARIAAEVVVALAVAWAARGGDHRAIADFKRAIEADPRRAEDSFRKVAMELERDPNAKAPSAAPALDSDALGSRALTRELQGDHAGALDDLRAAIANETEDRKSTRLNSSHVRISYAVFCLKKKKSKNSQVPENEST